MHSPDERRQLQQDAASGALGRDMQALAQHVEAGRTTWGEVFEGTSEYSDLLTPHLDRMVEENQEMLRQAIEDDEDFDPMAPVTRGLSGSRQARPAWGRRPAWVRGFRGSSLALLAPQPTEVSGG